MNYYIITNITMDNHLAQQIKKKQVEKYDYEQEYGIQFGLKKYSSVKQNKLVYYNAVQLAQIYGFPATPLAPTMARTIAIISFGGIVNISDCILYWKNVCLMTDNQIPNIQQINIPSSYTPVSDISSDIENMLDIQVAGACCRSNKVTIKIYCFQNNNNGFATAFETILGDPSINIVSCSWGAPEIYIGKTNLVMLDNLMASITNKGITICVASGDNGSDDAEVGIANIDFPSSSPHALACGGTSLTTSNNQYTSGTTETSWSGSGGGVSRAYLQPTYQQGIVSSSITTLMRATPDISFNSDPNTGILMVYNEREYIAGGTSCSAPAIAGYLACINSHKYVNPLIYSSYKTNKSIVHDITKGSNGRYSATIGYDCCTGLGSINSLILTPNLQ